MLVLGETVAGQSDRQLTGSSKIAVPEVVRTVMQSEAQGGRGRGTNKGRLHLKIFKNSREFSRPWGRGGVREGHFPDLFKTAQKKMFHMLPKA